MGLIRESRLGTRLSQYLHSRRDPRVTGRHYIARGHDRSWEVELESSNLVTLVDRLLGAGWEYRYPPFFEVLAALSKAMTRTYWTDVAVWARGGLCLIP